MVVSYRFFLAGITALTTLVIAQDLPFADIEKAYTTSYALERAQKYSDAMRALSPVLRAYENGYTINYRMGWLSYLNGNYADALRYYKRSLAVYPASIEVLNCVSLVYKEQNDWVKVEEQNYQILKIDYFNTTANYWYAVALKTRRKYDLAEKVCRKMLTVFPSSVWFLQELAETLYFKKQYKESLELFSSVHILDPTNEAAKKYLPLLARLTQKKE